MKNQVDKLKAILLDLSKVTETERSAIARRAFDEIAKLTSQKESLLTQFDEIASSLTSKELTDQLITELDSIRMRAEENAKILKSTATGAKEARQRLKKIREADLNTGAYGANGTALRNPNASTITTKA
ncbi:hypothetical protein [Hyphococcus lacteus]|uniref:Flagellar protein FlgN n=1 Tax=Hyphococcus lacteus TaxID=3143536 RepID=A0ABV3Z7B5_9PROT